MALPKVHEQGDGIRSLAGLLLNLMMPNYTVFLIDEPEALENQWDKLKHNGIDSITNPVVKEATERLIKKMNSVGIFPVWKGELESFFPGVGSHGPGYAVAVLEKYPNLGAAEYNDMREFVNSWGI